MQAIAVLEEAISSTSTAQLLLLLGKIQMKAGCWNEAVDSFNRCLAAIVSALLMHTLSCYHRHYCRHHHHHHRFIISNCPLGFYL